MDVRGIPGQEDPAEPVSGPLAAQGRAGEQLLNSYQAERHPIGAKVIADPGGRLASRYGLQRGGRVVIRPDGYIGLIASLEEDCADYFSRLAR